MPSDPSQLADLRDAVQKQRNHLATVRFGGDAGAIGKELLELAELHGLLEEHAESRTHYEEALGHFRQAKDKRGEAQALFGLGVVRANFEDHKGAMEHIAKAALLFNESKDREGEALCRAGIGESLRALGDRDAAAEKYQEALILFRQLKNRARITALLMDLGDLRMEGGDYAAARGRFLEALPLAEEDEDPVPAALCNLLLGECEGLLGNPEGARPHLLAAVNAYADLHDHLYEARARWDLGLACYHAQDWAAAREQFEAVLPLYEEQGRAEEAAKVKSVLAHFSARGV